MEYSADADVAAALLAILGALLVAAPVLLARWASWTPIVPGLILTGISIWAMTTNFETGGFDKIWRATSWAWTENQPVVAIFCANGEGLIVGLALLLSGVAAMIYRAGARRDIAAQQSQQPPGAPVEHSATRFRVTANLIGSMVGIVLVAGGLTLDLRFANQNIGARTFNYMFEADVGALLLVILGGLLVMTPALLARWASWTPIVPGVILAGISIWAMTTNAFTGGAGKIADATSWAFDTPLFAEFCAGGTALIVGLALIFSGIAAVLHRANVPRLRIAKRPV